jgi:hypothetical protein
MDCLYPAEVIESQLGQVVSIGSPAAGAGASYTYSIAEYHMLRSLCFQVVTSAAVANRVVYLDLIDGAGNRISRSSAGFNQTASLTTIYTFAAGIAAYGANAAASIGAPIPEVWLHPGAKFTIGVTAIDTGDQVSAINATYAQVFGGSYSDGS